MKQHLSEQEQQQLDRRVAEFEKRTGSQVVLAVVERSDSYAELPWKAFALGAGLAGGAVTVLDLLRPDWHSAAMVLVSVTVTLLCGAAFALACVGVPVFARLFLDGNRAETETRQYAESLFLSREVFAARGRTGILLMVSLFEHQVVILPDRGIAGRLDRDELGKVIGSMAASLSSGQVAAALEKGLETLAAALGTSAAPAAGSELPNTIIQEKGV